MIFQSIKTSDLSDGMINEILTLKDSHWNFGIKSQKKWFLKYVMSNDIHNIIKFKKKIVGYTSLSYRSFNSSSSKKLSNEKKYILFATFIIKRRFRNFFYASKMMKFNNKVILEKKKSSFLLFASFDSFRTVETQKQITTNKINNNTINPAFSDIFSP